MHSGLGFVTCEFQITLRYSIRIIMDGTDLIDLRLMPKQHHLILIMELIDLLK